MDRLERQHLKENTVARIGNPTTHLSDPRSIRELIMIHRCTVDTDVDCRVANRLKPDGCRAAAA